METQRSNAQEGWRERILRVLVFLQEHLDEEVALERLARLADASPYHFHRMFRGLVGEPVAAHVRRLRLERAAMRLKAGERSLIDLALEAGYESHEAFTRAFRRTFDMAPSTFRDAHAIGDRVSGNHPLADTALRGAAAFQPIDYDMSPRTFEIREMPATRVAFLRHIGPYNEVAPTWASLCAHAGRLGLMGPDVKMFGASYDDPEVTPADKLRYDACLVVGPDVEPSGELGVQELSGGRYAVTMHEGPYEGLAQTYGELFGRCFGNGEHQPKGTACFEHYQNDPRDTAPANLRTEIWVPLAE